MKRKAIFLTAQNPQLTDRFPLLHFMFQRLINQAFIGRESSEYNTRDAIKWAFVLDFDAIWLPFGGFSGYQLKFRLPIST